MLVHSATCSCIIEVLDFFLYRVLGVFAEFSHYIINFAGRISEAAMGGVEIIIFHCLIGQVEG